MIVLFLVTAILPHSDNIYRNKVPAAIYIGNGYGKLAGYSQVRELGNIETPIVLTNTLSVPVGMEALISYTLDMKGNEDVRSVNSIVGETNDGFLNDIRGRHVNVEHVLEATKKAESGSVAEGNVGAGTGTICFGWKGGIGTSSRVLPKSLGSYTIGVLVQTNFGGVLVIDGVPIGEELIEVLKNRAMSPLFMATIEATEEAIINSIFAAETMEGRDGHVIEALPVEKVLESMKKYGRVR